MFDTLAISRVFLAVMYLVTTRPVLKRENNKHCDKLFNVSRLREIAQQWYILYMHSYTYPCLVNVTGVDSSKMCVPFNFLIRAA